MKKTILLGSLFLFTIIFGMEENPIIILPSAEVLKKKINREGFDHLSEYIITELAEKELHPLEVARIIDQALPSKSQNPLVTIGTYMGKVALIQAILQDHPEAIKLLQEMDRL